ncbi:site-specific integrase [Geomonas ferrireducens]|uniref:site-specific integrase n=1 Tax=Geomonas ferrireducens TaxID=2570227 RepID=UPI0010A91386|nr:site-specific integrase [Geomonas ferrireducens]
MAKLIWAEKVRYECKPQIVDGNVKFTGGRLLKNIPALYDKDDNYVEPVNLRFMELAPDHKDLSSDAKALLSYWSYLEENELSWDYFNMPKNYKPTYRWKNELLRRADKGEMTYGTANTYVGRVVAFYKSAMVSGRLLIEDERFAPFKTVQIVILSDSTGEGNVRQIIVETTDLRIRVPKTARSLNPLEREEVRALVTVMKRHASKEFRLMVSLASLSGLRIDEVLTFNTNLVRPPTENEKRIEVEVGPHVQVNTKYGKKRTIEIPANLMRALYKYSISGRRLTRLENAIQTDNTTENLLFITQRGNRYNVKSVEKLWSDIRNIIRDTFDMNFKHHFHDLRVSYITYRLQSLLDAGIAPSEALSLLMALAGHKDEKTTWKYITYLKVHEVKKNAITMLDAIMEDVLNSGYE